MSPRHYKGPKNGVIKAQSAVRGDKKLSNLADQGLLALGDIISRSKKDDCAQQAVSVGVINEFTNHEDATYHHTSTTDEQRPEPKDQTE
ncbi:hypothetical protein N7509_000423 [Penicillium cosmopolitanum]|uniref:Uncharacterized protein n=1 Tax=Penicillium cosmopolitanum TaxID=1131564 RepID=A0A9W9WA96_9EURO|nr:uncharacterized protein N7509_000423 [Penicillium cosmopolitanum]KAJ5413796.1 hypothetical protein N7509_000423 [Penicillium cosmopolitanum]